MAMIGKCIVLGQYTDEGSVVLSKELGGRLIETGKESKRIEVQDTRTSYLSNVVLTQCCIDTEACRLKYLHLRRRKAERRK